MRPFNLKEYLANPSRKVITRNGKNVRIICTDRKNSGGNDNYLIIALIKKQEDNEVHLSFSKDGKYRKDVESWCDLFFAPEKKEGWLNIYNSNIGIYVGSGYVYSSLIEAKDHIREDLPYLSTIKVEWEE